jgi:hypothetical protein
MSKSPKTWHLETADGRPVYTDGQGGYSLAAGPIAEFIETDNQEADKEALRQQVSRLLGMEIRAVPTTTGQ